MPRKRSLLGLDCALEVDRLHSQGVPLTRIFADLELAPNWSYPTFIKYFRADDDNRKPDWLEAEPKFQETPSNWEFIGSWPVGRWRLR